ncbi:macrolide family glycosyltransferase [Streptosporangium sp. LJ11]|uniref:macrolide family glycosyltransferase n=1 Tax=Streptosporangium sp. LJ11 TaxID=3436927 RepID=UPI003F78D2F6
MAHLAFFNIPAAGHLMPTLAVVEELVRRGHRVTYPATEKYAEEVASTGATVLTYESTIDVQRDFPPGVDNWLARVLLGGAQEGLAVTRMFDARLRDDLPDVVVYDGFVRFVGEALAARWKRPAVRVYPVGCVSSHVTPEAIGEAKYAELKAELRELADMNDIDPEVAFHQLRGDPDALKLVFYPSRFGYVDAATDDRFVFVGPCFRRRELDGDWRPPGSGAPVALISLGTSFNEQPDIFRACIDAFTGLPWHVVITTGPGVDPAEIGPLPPNVEIHEWIPLQAVLRHAAVMVCTGGTGTVMHALYAGVPLVVMPQIAAADGLAAQLAGFGVGRVIARGEETADNVRAAVLDLTADDSARDKVLDLQRHVRESGGKVRAADEILAYLEERKA